MNKQSKIWIAIIIIVLGAVAYWVYYARVSIVSESSQSAIEQLELQETSDEVSDIEKDLNATSLEGLDSELSDIDATL